MENKNNPDFINMKKIYDPDADEDET